MTIQAIEYGDGYWKARFAGKGWKAHFGKSLQSVLGQLLWVQQGEFQFVGDGVSIDVRYYNGLREYYGPTGSLDFSWQKGSRRRA